MNVECPKCFGTGKLTHFRQVQGGVCFLCGGAKAVTQAEAGGWLAAQIRGDFARTEGLQVAPVAAPDSRASGKAVKLAGLGTCWIRRCKAGAAGAFSVSIPSDVGELPAWFNVTNGKIAIVEGCNGLRNRWAEIEAALQQAFKGAATA